MTNTREELSAAIIDTEWKIFQDVPNMGGKASCQEDFNTFQKMRSSQVASWSEATLKSYLSDLREAENEERNLFTEKYARMMQTTWPLEYERIKHMLPQVDPRANEYIEQIVQAVLKWEKELVEKYPYILKRGRPLSSHEDAPGITSINTYLRGELATYSLNTLALYLANVRQQQSEGINGSAITLADMMRQYGFRSLEEANEKLKTRV
jgi:hypothetical protein